MSAQVRAMLAPALRRIGLMVGRALVRLVDDNRGLQLLQLDLLSDETRGNVERVQNYGFTAHPHPGAEAAAVAVGGSRDHLLVVAVDDRRYRLQGLAEGEVAIYTDEGDRVVLRRGGTIEVHAATRVLLVSPLVECSADLLVNGNAHVLGTVVADGDVLAGGNVADAGGAKSMAGMRAAFNPHKHGSGPGPDRAM